MIEEKKKIDKIDKQLQGLFADEELNGFIDNTYVPIEKVQEMADKSGATDDEIWDRLKKINKRVSELLSKYCDISPYIAVFGMAASGKTTLSNKLGSTYGREVISIDQLLEKLREKNPDYPQQDGRSNDFRKHEYKIVLLLLISGLAKEKILDLGAGVLLQPAIAYMLKDKLIYLEINSENRKFNLVQDILLSQGHRPTLLKNIKENSRFDQEAFTILETKYLNFIKDNISLTTPNERLTAFERNLEDEVKAVYSLIKECCENFDKNNLWRLNIFEIYGIQPQNFNEALLSLKGKMEEQEQYNSVQQPRIPSGAASTATPLTPTDPLWRQRVRQDKEQDKGSPTKQSLTQLGK